MNKLLLSCTIFVLLTPFLTYAQARGRIGVFVAPTFGWGWYDPFWSPYPYGGYYYTPITGAIKFDTRIKETAVLVDQGYAGTVGQLKTMHVRPGSYNIELRAPGNIPYKEKVYVASGKSGPPHLTFYKYADRYFLRQVWDQEGKGTNIPVSAQERKLIEAQQRAKAPVEEVALVAHR